MPAPFVLLFFCSFIIIKTDPKRLLSADKVLWIVTGNRDIEMLKKEKAGGSHEKMV
ncbi:hypothetical protein PMF13cell1_03440 [Blautia producta]|uniref:Uncharacterized protein n=1 Tax=Blautia producta TaxID=33035 RepID=A0A4P6M3D9_9FIRM|nr:hypothetical protein PMF13cell1_03440 [Blautia producta]